MGLGLTALERNYGRSRARVDPFRTRVQIHVFNVAEVNRFEVGQCPGAHRCSNPTQKQMRRQSLICRAADGRAIAPRGTIGKIIDLVFCFCRRQLVTRRGVRRRRIKLQRLQ